MKFWIVFVLTAVILFYPHAVKAEGEFATSYAVSYDVDASGVTSVNEDITLRNLTDKYFASDFSLTISASQLNDLIASDKQGELEVSQQQIDGKTVVKVKFKQQVVGQNKEYKFNLKFKSPDFAQNRGQIWQVMVPKTPNLSAEDQFLLKVAVPVNFGDPTSIIPEPLTQRESGGKINYTFDKTQLQQSGVMANFGSEQWLDFILKYDIKNDSILPAIMQVPIPANTTYQKVLINQIDPIPENVTIDNEGNYLAWFKVNQRQSLPVRILGQAHLQLKPLNRSSSLSTEMLADLTKRAKYWEVDNPAIKDRLEQILGPDGVKLGVADRAKLIGHYVASYLGFDRQRREAQNYTRFGAVTALNNPTTALSSEYSDLFVTLARAAGIPARRLEGYAFSNNAVLRPTSLGPNLHSWAEYYDSNQGWVMVDPTWENTTGGADYVSRFDLDHLVLVTLGRSSQLDYDWPEVELNLSSVEFKPRSEVKLAIETPNDLVSGWPLTVNIRGLNTGNVLVPPAHFLVSSQHLLVPPSAKLVATPAVPPFGRFNYNFALRGDKFWSSEDDLLTVNWHGAIVTRELQVAPFYQNRGILLALIGFLVVTVGMYISALTLHVKIQRKR